MVTELLEKAIAEASKLSPAEQETLAAWILAELASERRWAEAFATSREALAALAEEALAEDGRRQTLTLDPDRL